MPNTASAFAQQEWFEQKIRPVLVERCYACHSQEAKQSNKLKAGLYVDTAQGLLTGGESGPAIVKGKAAERLLLQALRHEGFAMPPDAKLPPDGVANYVP